MEKLMVFEGFQVEILEVNSKILFNAKDVANCLDIKDVNSITRDYKANHIIKLKNSDMHTTHNRKLNNAGENFLTESGVYKLIFKSRKESAERFQDWVTDEVLPQIKKTGGYIPINEEDSEEMIMAKAFQIMQKTIAKKDEIIELQKPKVEGYNAFLDSKNNIDFSEFVKSAKLSIGRNTFMSILRDKEILRSNNEPYQTYIDREYFQVIQTVKNNYSISKTIITKKGVDWLIKKCDKWEIIRK